MSTRQALLQAMLGLALAVALLTACGETQTAPTHTTLPTATLVPRLEGFLFDKDSGTPVVGARVVLCIRDPEQPSCTVDSGLTSVTDSSGHYNITDVESRDYCVLYNISGEARPEWDRVDLDYSPVQEAGVQPPAHLNRLLRSLGAGQASVCAASFQVVDGNLVLSGYVYAESADLAFVFQKGDLLYVTIQDGLGKVDLAVWDTVTEDNCSGGSFDPLRQGNGSTE